VKKKGKAIERVKNINIFIKQIEYEDAWKKVIEAFDRAERIRKELERIKLFKWLGVKPIEEC